MTYTVKQVSKILNISEHTLRYYDRQGLLPFLHKNSAGTRLFTDADLCLVDLIKCLKKSNMSLTNIREYIELAMSTQNTDDKQLSILKNQRDILLTQMEELKESLCTINYKIDHYGHYECQEHCCHNTNENSYTKRL